MAPRDRYGNHPYGAVHKAQRRRFAQAMRAGTVFYCWRPNCPTPDVPINSRSWDLGHVDPEFQHQFGSRWPEHPRCNRRTVSHLKERLAGEVGREETSPRGELAEWRPGERFGEWPDPTPGNTVDRWSRHWSGPFNPRCPECRRTGEPCEAARRFEAEEAVA